MPSMSGHLSFFYLNLQAFCGPLCFTVAAISLVFVLAVLTFLKSNENGIVDDSENCPFQLLTAHLEVWAIFL